MAQYNGFKCDSCGKIFDPEDRTKVTVRYEGKVEGEYFLDKCPDCTVVPDGITLKPLRRRRAKSDM